MVDRIKQVMGYYKETPAGFAEKIGVNRSNLTHVFTGRNQPSLDFAKKVLVAFPEVSTEWLIMGVGKMIKEAEEIMSVKREFIQTELFGNVDDITPASVSEIVPEIVVDPVTIGKETPIHAPSVNNSLENVKLEIQETPTVEPIQQIDTECIKSVDKPVFTVPESNIQQQPIPQPEKSDSRTVECMDTTTAQSHSNSQPKEKPAIPSVEKTVAVQAEQFPAPREKKIEKIIFFYDDESFKVYHP